MSVNEAVAADVFYHCDDGVAYTLGSVVTYKELNGMRIILEAVLLIITCGSMWTVLAA